MLTIRNALPHPSKDEDAIEDERRLARSVRLGEQFKNAGAASLVYNKDHTEAYVVATVLSTTNWRPVAQQRLKLTLKRPYQAEFLGWTEAPLFLEVLPWLPVEPDVLFIDGPGVAHPRRCGVATLVGLALDHPTVGISGYWPRGCKDIGATMSKNRGDKTVLLHDPSGNKVGYQVYTQPNEDPIFVSPGHRVSVEDAAILALRCAPWYRTPEPLRAAREAAEAFRKEDQDTGTN